jgi:hypothetical protein
MVEQEIMEIIPRGNMKQSQYDLLVKLIGIYYRANGLMLHIVPAPDTRNKKLRLIRGDK